LALAVTQFGLLSEHIAVAARRNGDSWFLMLAVVIAATKVIHELAHASACRIFGAECREIGVMFLVGIPCLYCDVSDAWMLPQRWKRIMVSAAGIAAELGIAAIATLIWWFSADGVVRDLCVTIMIVCSVSTVIFNGNPLLRYDGYFILSDLVGIPNLSSQANEKLRRSVQMILWGSNPAIHVEQLGGQGSRGARNRFLLVYAVASGVYRTIVYSTILYLIYRFADGYGMGKIAGTFAIAIIGLVTAKHLGDLCRRPASGKTSRHSRPKLIAIVGVVFIIALLLIPLPRTVVAPSMVHPSQPHPIYATVAGRLVTSVRYGDQVNQGETIAQLESDDSKQEQIRLRTECERLELELDTLQKRRSIDTVANAKIPAITEALRSAEHQRALHEQQMQRLTIRAPINGTVYASDARHEEIVFTDRVADPQELLPLSPGRLGSWIDPGTAVCMLGAAVSRDAILWVRQQDIPLIRTGQSIQLLLPDYPSATIRGQITEIATEPAELVDRELFLGGLIEPNLGGEQHRRPRETMYRVRVRLNQFSENLPIRRTAFARVEVSPASLLTRVSRWLQDAFRFPS
jgi:putative peptide zinc metalloprotease protein